MDLAKTYNSRDSLLVTHEATSGPVSCLSTAERTGSAGVKILWSYVQVGALEVYLTALQQAEIDRTKGRGREQGSGILYWLAPGCVAGVGNWWRAIAVRSP